MEAFLISLVINIAIGMLAFKLQKLEGRKPYALSDLQVPTATEDRAQSYGAGVFPVAGNIVYFGNYRYVEKFKKIKAFFGLVSKKQPIGFEIYLTTWQTLVGIPCDELQEIRDGDKTIWKGSLPLSKTGTTTLTVNKRYANGPGDDLLDGVAGTFTFFNQELQPDSSYTAPLPNPQIAALVGVASADLPGYPNTLHCVFDGMVGISQQLKPLTYVVGRKPAVKSLLKPGVVLSYPLAGTITSSSDDPVKLAAQALITASSDVNGDANPALVELEVLTTQAGGVGPKLAPTTVDIGSYLRAAERLKAESHGVSFGWAVDRPVSELMKDLMAQAYSRRETVSATGQIAMHLVREDETPVIHFNKSNITRIDSFKRADPILAPNMVEVPFIDRNADWTERLAIAKNPAAARGAGKAIDIRLEFIGLSQGPLAQRIAEREQRKYASPLASIRFEAHVPPGTFLKPLQLCTLEHPTLSQTVRIRLASVRYGTGLDQMKVEIEAIEDLFRQGIAGAGTVTLPPSSPPAFVAPEPLSAATLTLAPYALHGDDADHALYVAFDDSSTARSFSLAYQPRFAWSDTIDPDFAEGLFEPSIRGTVAVAVGSTVSLPALEMTLTAAAAAQWSREQRGQILLRCGAEWLAASNWTLSGTTLTATGVLRGILDTQPVHLVAGATVELLLGLAIVPDRLKTSPGGLPAYDGLLYAVARAESRGVAGYTEVNDSDASEAIIFQSDSTMRAPLPLAPCTVEVSGKIGVYSMAETLPTLGRGSSYTVVWKNRNRLSRSISNWFASGSAGEPGATTRARLEYETSPGSWYAIAETTAPEYSTSLSLSASSLPAGARTIRIRIRAEKPGVPSPWHAFHYYVTS